MTRLGKGLLIGCVVLLVLLAIGITFTVGWRPFFGPNARPLTSRTFERTPQRLERGRYIATALSGCIYCHSPHEWTAPGTPMTAGMEGAGEVEPYADLPGRIVAPNLTPDPETGAGTWSDDQLARAIREGIGHDGRALFPLMPYTRFRNMSDEDLASVIVYLRSLPAVKNPLPKTDIIFPVKYLIRNVPEPVDCASPRRREFVRPREVWRTPGQPGGMWRLSHLAGAGKERAWHGFRRRTCPSPAHGAMSPARTSRPTRPASSITPMISLCR